MNKNSFLDALRNIFKKARNEMGELAYMVPVKELTGTRKLTKKLKIY